MKFAKEIEQDLIPEWRAKYIDYKAGKRKIKNLQRSIRVAQSSPYFQRQSFILPPTGPSDSSRTLNNDSVKFTKAFTGSTSPFQAGQTHSRDSSDDSGTKKPLLQQQYDRNTPIPIPVIRRDLNGEPDLGSVSPANKGLTNYGSFQPEPDKPVPIEPLPQLNIGAPALDPSDGSSVLRFPLSSAAQDVKRPDRRATLQPSSKVRFDHTSEGTASERNKLARRPSTFKQRAKSLSHKIFSGSVKERLSPSTQGDEFPMEIYQAVQDKKDEFFEWMQEELDKVEDFYKMKEDEATRRLTTLRDQLHEMRDRRLQEVLVAQQRKKKDEANVYDKIKHDLAEDLQKPAWRHPIVHFKDAVLRKPAQETNTKAMQHLGSPDTPAAVQALQNAENNSDFVRRRGSHAVPYSLAKRKLKLAMQEYYRGLELLKSYVLLNRKAFRKIHKKYDKAAHARPALRFMTEKVNRAWFVQSEVLDHHITTTEDLYARYFERGNHKIAVGKLRNSLSSSREWYGSTYRGAFLLGAGLVFGIQGIVYGGIRLSDPDPQIRVQTSYLLQLYGGLLMGLLMIFLFCLDCAFWTTEKINYVFVFEFDSRHHLDWKQQLEIPSLMTFLLGIFMWLNFGVHDIRFVGYLYYFPILLGIMVFITFVPLRIIYHRTRLWLAYSLWRLFCAGLFPVEFRDFFLGDIFCSLTYGMGNIELFFCLYSGHWNDPPICNSSHSRLLGFFSCLPGIWRFLQCVRRYYDTRNAFPHLANCGKYGFTILFYMTLSLYRIDKTPHFRALFIVFGVVNSTYCSIWDIFMDWSLGNPYAKPKFLRTVRGYKSNWIYYAAMVIDPILRFNWIFYAIFFNEVQHSAILSFFISLSEVLRRGMWAVLRMENEHCTNVGRFRASRDIPLPYAVPTPEGSTSSLTHSVSAPQTPVVAPGSAPARPGDIDVERADSRPQAGTSTSSPAVPTVSTTPSSLRRRKTRRGDGEAGAITPVTPLVRAFSVVGQAMSRAHAQDFERKRKPGDTPESRGATNTSATNLTPSEALGEHRSHLHQQDSSTDEDDDDTEDEEARKHEVERLLEDVERDKAERIARAGKKREE